MEIAAIIELLIGATKVVSELGKAIGTLNAGSELTPEQVATIKAEQAAAQARNDAAIGGALGESEE